MAFTIVKSATFLKIDQNQPAAFPVFDFGTCIGQNRNNWLTVTKMSPVKIDQPDLGFWPVLWSKPAKKPKKPPKLIF